jgi:hypothetical protein
LMEKTALFRDAKISVLKTARNLAARDVVS